MVYIKDWTEFQQRSVALYTSSPTRARYLLKARPSTHTLTLKVTDDTTTLKFRTHSSVILGRLEVFNRAMMAAMAGHPRPLAHVLESTQAPAPAPAAAAAASQDTSVPAPTQGGGGGGKKKKKKGKK